MAIVLAVALIGILAQGALIARAEYEAGAEPIAPFLGEFADLLADGALFGAAVAEDHEPALDPAIADNVEAAEVAELVSRIEQPAGRIEEARDGRAVGHADKALAVGSRSHRTGHERTVAAAQADTPLLEVLIVIGHEIGMRRIDTVVVQGHLDAKARVIVPDVEDVQGVKRPLIREQVVGGERLRELYV